MKFYERGGLRLLLVLALATCVRLAPLWNISAESPQAIERADIAHNLATGQGFRLDLKTNYVVDEPVIHFGGYEHPVVPLDVLAVLSRFMGAKWGARLLSLAMVLIALALLDSALRRRVGPETALLAGLMIAIFPPLLASSTDSPIAATMFAAVALIAWAALGERSALMMGVACAAAFVVHPALAVLAPVCLLLALGDAWHARRAKPFVVFAVACLTGPIWVYLFNRILGAPGGTLPQAWLYRVLDEADGQRHLLAAHIYDTPWALLHEQGRAVAVRIAHRTLNLCGELVRVSGLGMLWPLLPIAAIGAWQAAPLRRFLWLVPLALALWALDAATWSLHDPTSLVPLGGALLVILIVTGLLEALGREPLRDTAKARFSAAHFALALIALIWLAADARLDWHALRDVRARRGVVAAEAPGFVSPALASALRVHAEGMPAGIVATNEPWRLHAATGLPTLLLPYDLSGKLWDALLDRLAVGFVVVDTASWPEADQPALRDFTARLEAGNWQALPASGTLRAWSAPNVGEAIWRNKS